MQAWAFIRPDAVLALEHPMIKKILPNYVKAVNDSQPANFMVLKKVEFEFDKSLSNKEMWKQHKKLMKKFKVF